MTLDTGTLVTVTEKAAEKAKQLLAERNVANGALRVFVVGGGCSGYQYGMAIARQVEEGDISIDVNGVTIVVDEESAPLLDGAEVDYVEDLMKSGFTIFNPNATKSCACGSSFQTADGSGQAKACC
ncbi:MAG: iron-sulfur cluster insertion protein ErpA [Dehalococcoidia bacterium]